MLNTAENEYEILALGMSFGIFGADQLQKLIDSSGFGLAYLKSKYSLLALNE